MEDSAKLVQNQLGQKLVRAKKQTKPKQPALAQDDTIVQYLYKTKMCYHWQSGYCLMGNNCNFAHGLHELRIPRTFAAMNQKDQEVHSGVPPDNIFNHNIAASGLHDFKQGPAEQESFQVAASKGGRNGDLVPDMAFGPGANAANKSEVDFLEVEGDLGENILVEKDSTKPQESIEEEKKYFQIEGNHDKPFGGDFNGEPIGSGSALKPLKVKIVKSALEEQAESVQTPKWAGWLLDTPQNIPSPEKEGVPRVPADSKCPMCGHYEPEKRDAEVQCSLLVENGNGK